MTRPTTMTEAQKLLFWREWAKACRWQKWDSKRSEIERRAMLARCGFSSLTHVNRMAGFDRVLAHVRFLQDNLQGAREVDHPEDGERRRLLWVIREELLPGLAEYVEDAGAYMGAVIRDKFPWRLPVPAEGEDVAASPALLEELEARPTLSPRGDASAPSELEQLRMTLTQRLSDFRRKGNPRGKRVTRLGIAAEIGTANVAAGRVAGPGEAEHGAPLHVAGALAGHVSPPGQEEEPF